MIEKRESMAELKNYFNNRRKFIDTTDEKLQLYYEETEKINIAFLFCSSVINNPIL